MPRLTLLTVFLAGASLSGCFCVPVTATAVVEPIPGELGYTVTGSYDLEGTITKDSPSDPDWTFDGSFVFTTGGYSVAEPEVVVMESFPEQVRITLPVTPPPPGAIVTQALEEVFVAASIYASNEAQFEVIVRTDCPRILF